MTPEVNNQAVSELIHLLKLNPHPEGGFYRQVHKSKQQVMLTEPMHHSAKQRSAGTSIYYLLNSGDFSAWHRIRSDEVWYYHLGSPITIHELEPDTQYYRQTVLGNPLIHHEMMLQCVVKAGTWFAASVNQANSFSLVGCGVAPGFEFADFELADRAQLTALFPEYKNIIAQYTRVMQV